MKNVLGICNLHDNPRLGQLTAKRPIGAVTFLGRYGLMDFTLSNFSNSGINRVHVLVESRAAAILNHIGSGQVWINNTKTGSLTLHLNEKALGSPKFNTDIANILETMDIESLNFEHVVIAPSCFLTSMDLNPVLQAHKDGDHDITVVYAHRKDSEENFANCDLFNIADDGRINESFVNKGKSNDVSLETFVIKKDVFLRLLKEAKKISSIYSIRDMVNYYINNHKFNVFGYNFDGYVAPMLSLEHYIKYSFELLNYKKRCQLFKTEWPIYTTTHNTPPALYGKNAEVNNCFIANGSQIYGKVTNSIISRDVIINEGAVVKNSIIFTNSEVGENVQVEYVLSDKNVSMTTTKKLKGKADEYLYIKGGTII